MLKANSTAGLTLARNASAAVPSLPPCSTQPKTVACPTYDEITKTRNSKLNPGLVTYYKKPIYITQGSMQYLWDNTGKRCASPK